MKIKKSIIASLVVMATITSSVNTAFAKDIQSSNTFINTNSKVTQITNDKKSNLKVLNNSLSNTQYTYNQGGKSFKVIEHANDNCTIIDSTVYIKQDNDEYTLYSKIQTTIENGTITQKTTKDSVTTLESDKIDSLVKSNVNSNNSSLLFSQSNIVAPPPEGGSTLTPWQYSGHFTGSNRIFKYTLTSVATVLGIVIAGPIGGQGGAILGGIVSNIASSIINDQIDTVYYAQDVWYRYTTLPSGMKLPRAERTYTKFYSDRNRTQQIGSPVSYDHYVN